MLNLIFVVNDLGFGDIRLRADDIANSLLDARHWLYSPTTPHVKEIEAGDRVVLYLAGPNRRHFYASFEIAGPVTQDLPEMTGLMGDRLPRVFSLSSPIENIERWATPVPARPIKDSLEFIKDKQYWGLHFRQSARIISDADYDRIQQERCRLATK